MAGMKTILNPAPAEGSILSFPERGPWGDARWPGNCSGMIYRDLFLRFKPKVFCDPMVGSGTSVEVAREMNIEAYGLDLHSGFNILRDSILNVIGRPADLVLAHPPYGPAVKYSGNCWGDAPHPDDLSHCADAADFHQKLFQAVLNQRDATRNGGYYGVIIGDWRRDGEYVSPQAELIARLPAGELASIAIKVQHNTRSGRRQYPGMVLPRIEHEFIVLWQRKGGTVYHLLAGMARAQAQRLAGTWRAIVRAVMIALGGEAPLERVYEAVAQGCSERIANNVHWKAKIRQVLNSSSEYRPIARGHWQLI